MAMTRKEFLASAASVGALSACAGERFWLPRKDSLRLVKSEEEMYKELCQWMFSTVAQSPINDIVVDMGKYGAMRGQAINWKRANSITIKNVKNIDGYAFTQTYFNTINLPDVTSLNGWSFYQAYNCTEFNIPNLSSGHFLALNDSVSSSKPINVRINKTCDNIKLIHGFPFNSEATQFPYITFIGSDGMLTYNQTTSTWDFTPNA